MRKEKALYHYDPGTHMTCTYLRRMLITRNLKPRLVRAVKVLKHHDFDTIAFRGMSGALIAPILAMRLKKELILVRKGESSHSELEVEGHKAVKRYVIVDDFISTGDTAREIYDKVLKLAPEAKCVGVMEFQDLDNTQEVERQSSQLTAVPLRSCIGNVKERA